MTAVLTPFDHMNHGTFRRSVDTDVKVTISSVTASLLIACEVEHAHPLMTLASSITSCFRMLMSN